MLGVVKGVVTVPDVARLNFELDDELHARAKSAAALSGLRLKEFVADAVRVAVELFEAERAEADRRRLGR